MPATAHSDDRPVTVTFLGGLGEIGRNCAAIECDGSILLVDCGLMFPDNDMLGVDVVLPDFSWLIERGNDIVGCVLTHGHEDHIGALGYLLRETTFPIYGAPLTVRLAEPRVLESRPLAPPKFNAIPDGGSVELGPFTVETVPMTHSVPHGTGLAILTPQGIIFHTGDFKVDLTPVDGRRCDLSRIGALAEEPGIRLMLSDSTNANKAGYTRSETQVGQVLFDIMRRHAGKRIITACFASHLHRVQQVADAAVELGRVIVPMGRSMSRNIAVGIDMGLLQIPSGALADADELDELDPGRVCVVSTGSQGEPMSALARMGAGDSKWLTVGDGDVVILSSHPIPGNEHSVNKVIDNLSRLGAEVIHSGIADVHATGHAQQEELKLMLSLVHPEYFIPVHGEFSHMLHHAKLASVMGMNASHVLVCEDGDQVELSSSGMRRSGTVPSEYIFVDGSSVGEVGDSVLSDRRILGAEGVVTAAVCINTERRELVGEPKVLTRGWVQEPESIALVKEGQRRIAVAVQEALDAGETSEDKLRSVVRRALGTHINKSTRRRPVILPTVVLVTTE